MEIIESSDNSNWVLEYLLEEDTPFPAGMLPALVPESIGGSSWPLQPFNSSPTVSVNVDSSFGASGGFKEVGSKKRSSAESSWNASGSKAACRERLRRNNLNERFLELCSILEPLKQPKPDKAAILSDAVQVVTQLRSETQMLKESNENLQEKIKRLKSERNELRDEKQSLKADNKKLERQVRAISSARRGALPQLPQGQAAANNLLPFIGYPGIAMCQFMPTATTDTSEDDIC